MLLPDDYFSTDTRRYPVMYLLHGGLQDFRKFDMEDDIRGLTTGRPLIVVMPDGGTAGWYSNPVRLVLRPAQLGDVPHQPADPVDRRELPHVGRVQRERRVGVLDGWLRRAQVHSEVLRPLRIGERALGAGQPASRWRRGRALGEPEFEGADLNGGTMYGEPFLDQGRVTADNPVERLDSYATSGSSWSAGSTRTSTKRWFAPGSASSVGC